MSAALQGWPAWALLVVANVPVYRVLGRAVFDDWSGFRRCVHHGFTPDIVSFLLGEFLDSRWAQFKLFAFGALSWAAVYAEHRLFFGPWI